MVARGTDRFERVREVRRTVIMGLEPADQIYEWDELPWVELGKDSRACLIAVDSNVPDGPMVMVGDYPPNLVAPAHWHDQGHIEIVIEGVLYVGGRAERPGSVRVVPGGVKYGPLETGAEGAKTLVVFPNRTADALIGQFDPETREATGIDEDRVKATFAKLGVSV
jgi:hypothetical protein